MAERAASYAAAIAGKGAPLQVWVGFIDGTGIHIAPSGEGLRRSCYSGHKRYHLFKFQSIPRLTGWPFTGLALWRGAAIICSCTINPRLTSTCRPHW